MRYNEEDLVDVEEMDETEDEMEQPEETGVEETEEITVETTTRASTSPSTICPPIARSGIHNLVDHTYSDLNILCQQPTTGEIVCFKGHRLEIGPWSAKLEEVCKKVPNGVKTVLKVNAEPKTVAVLLAYLYTQEYSDDIGASDVPGYKMTDAVGSSRTHQQQYEVPYDFNMNSSSDISETNQQLLLNVKVYAIALEYDIMPLVDLAAGQFRAILDTMTPPTPAEITNNEDNCNSDYDATGLTEVVKLVYSVTAAGSELRESMVRFAHRYRKKLFALERDTELGHNASEFLRDLHILWSREEMTTTTIKNEQLAELEAKTETQGSANQALQNQVTGLSAENEELRQQNIQLMAAQAQLNAIRNTAKVILHGNSSTQCDVTVETQKKRKRGKEGNDTLIFKCSCGQCFTQGPQKDTGGLFGLF